MPEAKPEDQSRPSWLTTPPAFKDSPAASTEKPTAAHWPREAQLHAEAAELREMLEHSLEHMSEDLQAEYRSRERLGRAEFMRESGKVLSKMVNRKLALGFTTWYTAWKALAVPVTANSGNKCDKSDESDEDNGHIDAPPSWLLQADQVMNEQLRLGVSSNVTSPVALKAKRDSMRTSLSDMLKVSYVLSKLVIHKLALGFEEWRAAIAPRDDTMSKALSYSINRNLSLGWNAWYSTWEEGAN